MLKTKMITYNVHDRGRKLRGVDRHFDTVALAALINSPVTQERVKLGDIQGYFGHWPRVKFGMATTEGGILDGKAISLPLALRTIHLSADDKGNITHQAEFLDTNEGHIAARLYESQTGGFSSAIDVMPRSSPSIPTAFHGFDFVLEPNYTTNRGHRAVLDAVAASDVEGREEMLAMLDAAVDESMGAASHLNTLLDAMQAQYTQALQALEHLAAENDLLIGQLASSGAVAVLDDAGGWVAPVRGGKTAADFERFRNEPLVELQKPGRAAEPAEAVADGEYRNLKRRFT